MVMLLCVTIEIWEFLIRFRKINKIERITQNYESSKRMIKLLVKIPKSLKIKLTDNRIDKVHGTINLV